MKVREIAEKLNMKILTGETGLDTQITKVYSCDLLSRVMSVGGEECLWITVHTHLNTVAVAMLSGIGCIVIPEDIDVETPTIEKAIDEDIPILSTQMGSYEISWRMHELLL